MGVRISYDYDRQTKSWAKHASHLDGLVIDHHSAQRRVSSDHAWIDSGQVFSVKFWNAEEGRVDHRDFSLDDCLVEVTNDAPAEFLALADQYEKAMAFLADVRSYVQTHTSILQGSKVQVFKGRKCPKGVYEVARQGTSEYGPWLHLRDESGKWYNYINADNVKPVADLSRVEKMVAKHLPAKYAPFVAEIVAKANIFSTRNFSNIVEFDATGWKVLADALADDDHPWAELVRKAGRHAG